MLEILLSYAVLLKVGLMSGREYNDLLNKLFMERPKDDLLLNLEWVSSDIHKTISIIHSYGMEYKVDYNAFGRALMNSLKKVYYNDKSQIEEFAAKVYAIWTNLPPAIQSVEPFWTMCYADDPLSWGDKAQTKELYEKMFCFYDEQSNTE